MPGTPPLESAPAVEKLAPKLARAAGALAVLSFGLALVVAPGAVLGNLLSVDAESIAGALLDVFVFGYILLKGAGLLSDGSELLLEVLNPGIIGGVVLPVLGALPDSLIILTALSAPAAEAQEQVAVGIGTLAGSTVLLLSLAWGVSVLLGRCDLSPLGVAVDKKHTRGWDLFNTGVTVDRDVRQGAQIMASSVLLYGFVQVPAFLGFSKSPQAALAGAAVCLIGMVAYCAYSVMYPGLQERRIDAARKKRFRMVAVKSLALQSSERYQAPLVDTYGRPIPSMVRQIFDDFDVDKNGYIDTDELPALLTTLKYASGGETVDEDGVKYLLKEFDTNADAQISYEEFDTALTRWVTEKLTSTAAAGGGGVQGFQRRYEQLMDPRSGGAAAAVLADLPYEDIEQLQETAAGLDQETPDEAAEDLEDQKPMSAAEIWRKSVLCLAAGVALCAVFSDPLVDALTNLSRATGIPPFVVGFVLTPLASNSSEFVSSLTFAARKRRKSMSLTLSQVYGAVTLNNTLVLGLFLMVVYLRGLEWVYSSEVTVIVASTLAIGFLGFSRSTFKAIWALPAIALYPLSLLGVYALDTFLGWQ
eukprot:GHUV01007547.1.p1 GENE.GHUV01007547.1~~GHUV01007547.1.p1  ORF type:complete len:589 (+),score=195.07 GHUV01007547.1:201-1967(+)